MTYSVEWHPKVRKFLRKLPTDISKRIVLKMQEASKEPFRYLEHYEGRDYYKLRVADYRMLIDVDLKNKVLFVQVLDHRGRIYDRN